jgi:CRP-like cAMP-binding protein
VQDLRADQDIVRVGERPSQCCLIIEGHTCRYNMTAEGKRQIFLLHMPGEIPDLHSLHIKTMDHTLGTITACTVGFIQHEVLHDLCIRYPRLGGAFSRETLIDAATFREWMMGLGRREAKERLAHFFCEMVTRLRAIVRVENLTCEWPYTQTEVGGRARPLDGARQSRA